ncbi:hypothetical protein [Cerasicoccus frondis]|uniref:hypothetical protein n=1 Tax=Cerasicoccus frondis TaxID=490090 RepID=UPI0028529287|nr:hypothetical protein [Cerasicoccus frondis]
MLTDKERRPLILRSNRFLGSALLERGLIKTDDLEAANEKLLEAVQSGNMRGANLLNILLYDVKAIDEAQLVEEITEDESLGLIDLTHYDMTKFREINVDIDLCYATYTVPFDRVEDFTMIATAYYMSKPTIQYWEETIGGNIIWYICSVASIAEAIERASQIAASSEEVAVKEGS